MKVGDAPGAQLILTQDLPIRPKAVGYLCGDAGNGLPAPLPAKGAMLRE